MAQLIMPGGRYSLCRTRAGRFRVAAPPGSTVIIAAAASQPAADDGQPGERHSRHRGDAELMGEDLPAEPAARDPGRDTDQQGDPGQRECLPAQRAADLP